MIETPHTQIQTCSKYFSWIVRNFGFCGLGTYTGCRGANKAKNGDFGDPYIVYPGSLKNLESKKYSQKSKMVKSEVGSGLFGP